MGGDAHGHREQAGLQANAGPPAGADGDSFILSGYPHRDECDLFARYVLPRIDHAPLSR